jgi:hypothetical protein
VCDILDEKLTRLFHPRPSIEIEQWYPEIGSLRVLVQSMLFGIDKEQPEVSVREYIPLFTGSILELAA